MKSICFLLLIFYSTFLISQNDFDCGTTVSKEDKKIILEFIKKVRSKQEMVAPEDSIVPVKFHIIGYSDSTGGIDSSDVFDELSLVNEYFKNAGIILQHCGPIQYIYENEYAKFEKIIDETICDEEDEFNNLNIYFVPELFKVVDGDTVYLCGYAYLSGLDKNRLIMLNSCSTNGSTLAHEIGHYFSLLHTHSSSNGHEFVNGTNCSTAGDLLCDTPADPKLSSLNVNQICVYVGNEQDPLGDFYNPDPTNIMSYSRKHCRDFFSQEQLDQMSNYFYTYRDYLSCQYNGHFNDPSQDFQFSIYPNPAYDQLAFSSNKIPLDPFVYNVIDITGKLVMEGHLTENSYINIGHLQYGIYLFVLSDGEEIHQVKFVKIESHL
jgi:hypothetical protein